jgi:hypothetical protein
MMFGAARAGMREFSEENELLIQRRPGARKEATMDYEAVKGDYSGGLNQVVAAAEFGQALAHSYVIKSVAVAHSLSLHMLERATKIRVDSQSRR